MFTNMVKGGSHSIRPGLMLSELDELMCQQHIIKDQFQKKKEV